MLSKYGKNKKKLFGSAPFKVITINWIKTKVLIHRQTVSSSHLLSTGWRSHRFLFPCCFKFLFRLVGMPTLVLSTTWFRWIVIYQRNVVVVRLDSLQKMQFKKVPENSIIFCVSASTLEKGSTVFVCATKKWSINRTQLSTRIQWI